MKSIFKIIVSMLLAVAYLNAEPVFPEGEKNGYEVKLTSEKSLIE